MNREKLRTLACEVLLDAGVRRLPVRITNVAQEMGVSVFTYAQYAATVGCTVADVARRYGNDGFTQQIGDKTVVFYYESGNMRRTRWTIAHELGHVLLGHLSGQGGEDADIEADALAAELLCPSAVAAACVCYYPCELSRLCDISLSAAYRRARELATWQSDPLPREMELVSSMQMFIEEQEVGKKEKQSDRELIFAPLPALRSHRI
ncbi:MAG: ImmA/IrrE family metallo-endopeptidase [Angelakisella sp.]